MMTTISQVLCFGMGCLSLGMSATCYVLFVVAGGNSYTTTFERVFATIPSIVALVIAGVFFTLTLMV